MHRTTVIATLLTTAFLLACGSGGSPAPGPAEAVGGDDAAAGPLGGASGGHDPLGLGNISAEERAEIEASHCELLESVWLSCTVEDGKTLSVCSHGDELIYRFGTPGQPLEIELGGPWSFAENTVETDASVAVSYSAHATGETHAVMFRNEGYRYEVMETFGSGEGFTGVMVYRDRKPLEPFYQQACGANAINHLSDRVAQSRPAESGGR